MCASSGDIDPQAVERIVGRVGLDHRRHPGPPGEGPLPELEIAASRARGCRRGRASPRPRGRPIVADDAFLADLHAAADAAVLQEGGAHQVLAPGDDAGGRSAKELVAGIERDVGALREEALEVVFGRRVDDHRNAARVAGLGEFVERDQAVVDDVVRHDIDRGGGPLGDRALQLVAPREGRLADRHDLRAGEADRLVDRRAIARPYGPAWIEDFVLQSGRIGQALDRAADRCRSSRRRRRGEMPAEQEAVTKPASAPHSRAITGWPALQVVDLDELRQDRRHRLDRFRDDDRGAKRRSSCRRR